MNRSARRALWPPQPTTVLIGRNRAAVRKLPSASQALAREVHEHPAALLAELSRGLSVCEVHEPEVFNHFFGA